MNLHSDLLRQAQQLATNEPKRPRQASLRRAVSAAYYALFHLLTLEASRLFVKDDLLLAMVNRTFNHGEMNKTSKEFAKGDLPKKFNPVKATMPVPVELKDVAQTFVDLQQARHEADYNLAKTFSRSETLTLIAQVRQSFSDWNAIRKHDLARVYLGSFLLWDKWEKGR